jgi:hypothetical protein
MNAGGPVTLVVSQSEKPFYTVVAHHRDQLNVTTDIPASQLPPTLIVSHAAYHPIKERTPTRIVTDPSSSDSDRFYIYKTDQK